jgi:hypothetical protein
MTPGVGGGCCVAGPLHDLGQLGHAGEQVGVRLPAEGGSVERAREYADDVRDARVGPGCQIVWGYRRPPERAAYS